MENLYDTLDIKKTASESEIKTAYRKQSKKTHPDKGGSEDEFDKTRKAYLILSNPDKRKEYDSTGNINSGEEFNILSGVSELFFHVVDHYNNSLKQTDIIKQMLKLVEISCKDFEKKIKIKRIEIEKQELLIGRITNEESNENIFEIFINDKIKLLKNQINTFQKEIDKLILVESVIEVYKCEVELSANPSGMKFNFENLHFT